MCCNRLSTEQCRRCFKMSTHQVLNYECSVLQRRGSCCPLVSFCIVLCCECVDHILVIYTKCPEGKCWCVWLLEPFFLCFPHTLLGGLVGVTPHPLTPLPPTPSGPSLHAAHPLHTQQPPTHPIPHFPNIPLSPPHCPTSPCLSVCPYTSCSEFLT